MEFYKVVNKVLSRINEYDKYALNMTAPTIKYLDGDEDDSNDRKEMHYSLNFSDQSQNCLTVKADISLSDDYNIIHVSLRLLAGTNSEISVIETRLLEGIYKITDEMIDDTLNEFFTKYEEEITINYDGIELKKMKITEIINYIETVFEPVLKEMTGKRSTYLPIIILTDGGEFRRRKLFIIDEGESIHFSVGIYPDDKVIALTCDYESIKSLPDITLRQEFLRTEATSKIDIDKFLDHCKRSLKGVI